MYVSKMVIQYECGNPSCKGEKVLGFNPGLIDVKDISKNIHFVKSCDKCSCAMFIVAIQAKVLDVKDNYGDAMKGVWICPIHTTVRYYPNAIRKSVESTTSYGAFSKDYREIARKGFPWKCPTCNNNLQYHKEEELPSGY